jgi:hypothetical protein
MENIFDKGCLIQLSISQWCARSKIDKAYLASVSNNTEWLNATKKLVDPASLKPIAKIANAARNYLHEISLPFPINGLVLIPKDLITEVDGELKSMKSVFTKEVSAFVETYNQLRETAKEHLGDLFDELDYPIDIKDRFSFNWRFVIIGVPDGSSKILSPEVYEREKQKFIETMEEARELAIQSLREEFAGLVERICDRFGTGVDGKPRIFKNSTVDSFYRYFDTFRSRNIFDDDQLSELVSQAQSLLQDASADSVRSNDVLKKRIKTGMEGIETAIEEVFVRPRRKVIM